MRTLKEFRRLTRPDQSRRGGSDPPISAPRQVRWRLAHRFVGRSPRRGAAERPVLPHGRYPREAAWTISAPRGDVLAAAGVVARARRRELNLPRSAPRREAASRSMAYPPSREATRRYERKRH